MTRSTITCWISLILVLLVALPVDAAPQCFGKIVAMPDGYSFTLLTNGQRLKARLAESDAPEKGNPFGNQAGEALADHQEMEGCGQ